MLSTHSPHSTRHQSHPLLALSIALIKHKQQPHSLLIVCFDCLVCLFFFCLFGRFPLACFCVCLFFFLSFTHTLFFFLLEESVSPPVPARRPPAAHRHRAAVSPAKLSLCCRILWAGGGVGGSFVGVWLGGRCRLLSSPLSQY